jgi:predicted small lipoprotein YifL
MRNVLLVLVLALSLAACGKKKSPANPQNTDTNAADEREEQDANKPADRDDAEKSSDPCEGGE